MMKNVFCFILKVIFVLNLYKFLSWLLGLIEKKRHANFKIYDVTIWLTNNDNTHIAQYLTK